LTPLYEISLEYTENEFSGKGIVSPRGWLILGTPGSKTSIEVKYNDKSFFSTGILGLTPLEKEILPVEKTILYGSWFEDEKENSVLISDKIAKELGIKNIDVGKAKINIYGEEFIVRGILIVKN
jgi:hypothetical protein